MKIVVATDSFKGTLSALEACNIIADVIKSDIPESEIVMKPLADGGEGTVEALINSENGQWIPAKVTGPLPEMKIDSGLGWFENQKLAVVEMAKASGIILLSKGQLNPMKTTTFGTGQLIKKAIEKGAHKILLTVGGSATVDGGIGAAMALGWQFLDEEKMLVPLGGQGLLKIKKVIPTAEKIPPVEVLCDVTNPLCGNNGAAKIYGPQKGATNEMVILLEAGLLHLAKIIKQQLNKDIKDLPGAGAAGGLSAGAVAFMNAKLVSGIDTVMKYSHFEKEAKGADWIITGEGSFDEQSLRGKVISGICKAVQGTQKIAVIAGKVSVDKNKYRKLGIYEAFSCQKTGMTLEYCFENAADLLRERTKELAKKIKY